MAISFARRFSGCATECQISKGLRAAAFASIVVTVLAGGCNSAPSKSEQKTAASDEVSQVSQALVGKRITVRGKFSLRGKLGARILLDDRQGVYLVPNGSFSWEKPYADMEDKLVTATGTLRFFHSPRPEPTTRAVARPPDHYYFEMETTQVRLVIP